MQPQLWNEPCTEARETILNGNNGLKFTLDSSKKILGLVLNIQSLGNYKYQESYKYSYQSYIARNNVYPDKERDLEPEGERDLDFD